MKKYSLTSSYFSGAVVFGYSDEGHLVLYSNGGEMTSQQHDWLLTNLPMHITHVDELAKVVKGKLEEMPSDLSFNCFWETYGKKINRKRTEPLYIKLDDVEKYRAIAGIVPYKNYLKRSGWRGQVDPEKYLRDRYFETNWNAEV